MINPKQWSIYVVDLEPRVGTKPGKQRPCLAIQPTEFSFFGLKSTVILPITTKLKDSAYPLRIRIPKNVAGLKKESDILIDQILAWDNSLFRELIGELPELLRERTKDALKEFLELD